MSSGTSTEQGDGRSVRLQADVRLKPDATSDRAGDQLQPWQFFVLAALGCATAVTFIARGQGYTSVILLGFLMAGAGLVGIAALRALRPLVSPEEDRTAMVGARTRTALEREKMLALRAIKELEFDRAMGKLSESDWQEMSGRLRTRAARLMRQLDAGAGYRDQIERDLEKRLSSTSDPKGSPNERAADVRGDSSSQEDMSRRGDVLPTSGNFCTQCGTRNDGDARFCKSCGNKL